MAKVREGLEIIDSFVSWTIYFQEVSKPKINFETMNMLIIVLEYSPKQDQAEGPGQAQGLCPEQYGNPDRHEDKEQCQYFARTALCNEDRDGSHITHETTQTDPSRFDEGGNRTFYIYSLLSSAKHLERLFAIGIF